MKKSLFQKRFILQKKGFTQYHFSEKSSGAGFTLTETTIVIAIFILIVMAIYSTYILSQRAYSSGERMAEITQNGRVILERITREIRQAGEIITEIQTERVDPSNEIIFHDGHIPLSSEEGIAQGASFSNIILSSSASGEDDYYKDIFLEITEGVGAGQIKKIVKYQGTTRTADIEGIWDIVPNSGSSYKIDSSYYYIRYYQDADSNISREIFSYCLTEDSLTCLEPKLYVPWNTIPQEGQSLLKFVLEESRIIGEYVSGLEFWGSRVINIALTLKKGEETINLETKVFGRNL